MNDGWQPVETAPENPREKYLAIDCCGFVHQTDHPRHVLMHAGWAEAWQPIPSFIKTRYESQKMIDGAREIIGSHAREFKRLIKAHKIDGEVIEGVMLAPSSDARAAHK